MALFGSIARGYAGPESDVDFLMTFQPGAQAGRINTASASRPALDFDIHW
ncbi:MAG TPA: hypothetical protein DCG54_02550 [Anaerolineae bacterium]|nr:hypothetical protein [Anaerolineae bacterium]